MADEKITDLTELTYANLADTDVLAVVDISDTTMDASGTTKKIKAVPDRVRAASFAANGGTETITASAGNLAVGYVNAASTRTASLVAGIANGAFAAGYVKASGRDSSISATGRGSFAEGYSYDGTITSSGIGAFVLGATAGGGGTFTGSGNGSFAQGYAYTGSIIASGKGGFAQGYATYGLISATGAGCFAQGYCYSYPNYIKAQDKGCFAQGYATGYNIFASGEGCMALGFTEFADIIASGQNTVQFGCGTNTVANSLQVGLKTRLHSDGWVEMQETSAPTVAVDTAVLYCEDNGSGKTRLVVKFNTGAVQILATQP